MVAAFGFVQLQARPWYEWVQSAQNPADILSREALDSPAVRKAIQEGAWTLRHLQPDWALILGSLDGLVQRASEFQDLQALA